MYVRLISILKKNPYIKRKQKYPDLRPEKIFHVQVCRTKEINNSKKGFRSKRRLVSFYQVVKDLVLLRELICVLQNKADNRLIRLEMFHAALRFLTTVSPGNQRSDRSLNTERGGWRRKLQQECVGAQRTLAKKEHEKEKDKLHRYILWFCEAF